MYECLDKYDDEKKKYLKNKILELYHLNSYDAYFDSEIIDIDDYSNEEVFINYVISSIEYRVNIVNTYSISKFNECKESTILEVTKLKGIIIYCGINNWNLQDIIYDYLDSKFDFKILEFKYGIILLTDY